MIRVLHNNSCSKSKAILEFLDENNIKFEIIDIIADPLSHIEILTLLKKLNMTPSQLLRTHDKAFIAKYGKGTVSDEQAMKILETEPQFMQRPILVKKEFAMIGRPLENAKLFVE
ncbi:MAG: arsenate reductase (glutaredoxin) [Chryseobacterium sp.]|nr:MAG: arsenate reductase (glutaredoxin) [Chryseobacterium sp.]